MMLHIHRYVEIPGAPAAVQSALAEHTPFGAVRLGRLWQWQDELWTIQLRAFPDARLLWHGACAAAPERTFLISATLHDAGVATQLELHAALDVPGLALLAPWTQRRTARRLAAAIDTALAALAAKLRAEAPGAPAVTDAAPEQLADTLRAAFPATVAAFEAMDALPNLAAVVALDARWQTTERGAAPAGVYARAATLPPVQERFDLIYAGGGLGLLHAAVMARRGYRVLLFDRGEVGCAHREWNISDGELRALIKLGLFSAAELETVVMRRYADGIVRFSADRTAVRPADLHMPNVLNVALDAAGLLGLTRRKLEAAGGRVLDHRAFRRVVVAGPGQVAVEVQGPDGQSATYAARLVVDGMGATSPLALERFAGQPFAGVCPTVGTVVTGLEHGTAPTQHNPDVGDILVSVTDTQRGRQLIWEGFAGRGDELTVYVFYYDVLRRNRQAVEARHSLLELFEDYFRLLPSYKRPGPEFRHLKPVYGFIPARHTVRRQSVPLLEGVLPIGDSSAQQSPLTFCGFGSHVRNLERTTGLVQYALDHELLAPRYLGQISAYQANVALNWVFSRFMQPWDSPADVNRLQNIFARVLNEVGVELAVRFFQDQMTWRDYGRIVNHTLEVYQGIIPTTLRVLGPAETARWVADWLRFSGEAAVAAAGRAAGTAALDRLEQRLERRPGAAFRVKARRAEWRAMGWAPQTPARPALV